MPGVDDLVKQIGQLSYLVIQHASFLLHKGVTIDILAISYFTNQAKFLFLAYFPSGQVQLSAPSFQCLYTVFMC